ncbi:MAG: hypothetical protein AAFZ11_13860 [Pseudomonadota bacterium]
MSVLGEAEAAFAAEPGFVDAGLALIGDEADYVGSGATWLLKSFLERGGTLSAPQTQALITALPRAAHWSTQLHLSQSIRHLSLTATQATACTDWIGPLLMHKRPFLRAWSLDALAHVAQAHAEYREEFRKALRQASEDPAASVRARARRCGPG